MKRGLMILGTMLLIIIGLMIFYNFSQNQKNSFHTLNEDNISPAVPLENQETNIIQTDESKPFQAPIDRVPQRVTKKPFGIFITPRNSPVQPERFQGYHTGTDFETFPEEKDADMPVKAICDGKILEKTDASGYGGVLVESCVYDGNPVTVVYGHLKLASIGKSAGQNLGAGEQIGILGKGYSPETDKERKHLHLGIHKGTAVNIRGYADSKNQLESWIDPTSVISVSK